MDNDNGAQPINILLSRDELLFVLNLLQAEFLPGLDADPLGELSPEQQALALVVAGRALQARELIRTPAEDELVLHPALLTAVGVSAYPQAAVFAYHWSPSEAEPDRYFGHVRGPDVVVHTRPAEVLHQFTVLPAKEQLVAGVLAFCQCAESPKAAALVLSLSSADLARVRELAEAGQVDAAVELLAAGQADAEAARSFVETLAHRPQVSIMRLIKQTGPEAAREQDVTLVQNSRHAWLITAPDPAGGTPLQVKTASRAEVGDLLASWLA